MIFSLSAARLFAAALYPPFEKRLRKTRQRQVDAACEVRAYMHTFIHSFFYNYMHAYMRICIHIAAQAVLARNPELISISVRVCMHIRASQAVLARNPEPERPTEDTFVRFKVDKVKVSCLVPLGPRPHP